MSRGDDDERGWRRLRVGGRVIALVPELQLSWVVPAPPRSRVPAPPDETRKILAERIDERARRRRRRS